MENSISLQLTSPRSTVGKMDNLQFSLNLINPNNKDISAIDLILTYDSNLVDWQNPTLADGWQLAYSKSDNNTAHYILVNPTKAREMGAVLSPISFSLKAKDNGNGTIGFSNVVVTARGEMQPLSIDSSKNQTGSYTVGQTATPTDTPIPSPINTPTPIPVQNDNVITIISPKDGENIVNANNIFFKWKPVAGTERYLIEIDNKLSLIAIGMNEVTKNNFIFDPNIETHTWNVKARSNDGAIIADSGLHSFVMLKPFTPNSIPGNVSAGTILTIGGTADPDQQAQAIITGNGLSKTIDLYDDGNHGDNAPNDGNYANVLDTTSMQDGSYKISYTVNGQSTSSDTNFMLTSSSATDQGCVPYIKNGDPSIKINLVVVPDYYYGDDFKNEFYNKDLPTNINYIFSKEPYKSNASKFNVWYVSKSFEVPLYNSERANSSWQTYTDFKFIEDYVARNCTYYSRILVFDKMSEVGASFTDGIAYYGGTAMIGPAGAPDAKYVLLHELGHSIGYLKDEYYMSKSSDTSESAPNCDVAGCPKWCSEKSNAEVPLCYTITDMSKCINTKYNNLNCQWTNNYCDYPYSNINFGQSCQTGTGCFYGCGGSAGYRPTIENIMIVSNRSDLNYDPVSMNAIQQRIDSMVR